MTIDVIFLHFVQCSHMGVFVNEFVTELGLRIRNHLLVHLHRRLDKLLPSKVKEVS